MTKNQVTIPNFIKKKKKKKRKKEKEKEKVTIPNNLLPMSNIKKISHHD
jgi:hypothetical protein